MKKLLLVLFISSCTSLKNEGGKMSEVSEKTLPVSIQDHIKRFCEAPKNSKFYSSSETDSSFYVAKIKCDKNDFLITYSTDGVPLMAEMTIGRDKLPDIVLTNLFVELPRNFEAFEIKGTSEITIHQHYKYRFLLKGTSLEGNYGYYAVYTDSYGSIREIKKFPD
ncbi:hypothetical protein RCC89_01350 [Cytophagaceae bacterium ABcell3]|nr:hypothetical protein RCC89_01350 [Cytophagaceae bacterium ABcell3]